MERGVQAITGQTARSASEGLGSKVKLIKQAWNPVVWEGSVPFGASPHKTKAGVDPSHELAQVDGTTDVHRGCSGHCCAPQTPRVPLRFRCILSQLQWLSSQSPGLPLCSRTSGLQSARIS